MHLEPVSIQAISSYQSFRFRQATTQPSYFKRLVFQGEGSLFSPFLTIPQLQRPIY
jgi:hypothetical protein